MTPQSRFYSVPAACSALNCGRTKLYRLIAGGHLDARKSVGTTLISRESVDRYLEALPDAKIGTPENKKKYTRKLA